MWTANRAPSRPQRTPSVYSIASVHSQASRPTSLVASPQFERRSGYESDHSSVTAIEDDIVTSFPAVPSDKMPAMWQSARQNSVSRLSQKFGTNVNVAEMTAPPPLRTQYRPQQRPVEYSPDDDNMSRASTLGGGDDYYLAQKTPTPFSRPPSKPAADPLPYYLPETHLPTHLRGGEDEYVKNMPKPKPELLPYHMAEEELPNHLRGGEQTYAKSVSKPSKSSKPSYAVQKFNGPIPYLLKEDQLPSHLRGGEDEYVKNMPKPQEEPLPYFLPDDQLPKHLRDGEPQTRRAGNASSGSANLASGSLESQLAAIMAKLVNIEKKSLAVGPPESSRLAALEKEKKQWTKRHESIWALRDEDVENNMKIRGDLAKTRRELDAMTKLRDDDLASNQALRARLAEANQQIERRNSAYSNNNGRTSPSRGRPGSIIMERRDTTNLFEAAKAAALEQRTLELEKRNNDLLQQIEVLKGGANIDGQNRMAAHKALKDSVSDLESRLRSKDVEIERLRAASISAAAAPSRPAPSGPTSTGVDWAKLEALHEEHSAYREKVGGRMQALRSEKESLQREVHRYEDKNHALEVKVKNLERRIGIM